MKDGENRLYQVAIHFLATPHGSSVGKTCVHCFKPLTKDDYFTRFPENYRPTPILKPESNRVLMGMPCVYFLEKIRWTI